VLRLRRPTEDELASIAERHRGDELAYAPVGATGSEELPPGYGHGRYATVIGHGPEVLARAVEALHAWQPQRGAGLTVAATGAVAVGTTLAFAAPMPVGYIVGTGRVVAAEPAPGGGFTYAYGTLPHHPERGEERFSVRADDTGAVHFDIVVFWRPHFWLARLGGPITRHLQAQATRRYLATMQSIGGG
jgi:uncharacterized protein (UPF0548 family)